MTKALEALNIIKNIGLSHMEYDSDENHDGEWEYEAVEVDDGTIEDNCPEEIEVIEKSLKDFEELKKGIAWRKAEYKKELDSGVDCDNIPLSETNRKIILNLYNIMCALESYYKEKN